MNRKVDRARENLGRVFIVKSSNYSIYLADFLKSKLCMPSPKEELIHKLFVWVNIDHLILQNRHIKS